VLTQSFIDRQRHIAENTHVAETASGVIVVAHPGQKVPTDPKVLREEFGILPDCPVIKLVDSKECPPFEKLEAQLAEQDGPEAKKAPARRGSSTEGE